MSRLLTSMAFGLALCFTSGSAAALASPTTARHDAETKARIARIDAQLDTLLADIVTRARNADAASLEALKEQFNKVRKALKQRAEAAKEHFPKAETDMQRLQRAIDALVERAQNATLKQQHVQHLRERLIDAKLDELIDDIAVRAKNADLTREEFNEFKALIEKRAEAAKAALPDVPNLRPKLMALVDDLVQRFENKQLKKEDVDLTLGMLIEARMDRGLAWVESPTFEGDVKMEEPYQYLRDIINDRADILAVIQPDTPPTLRQRWQAAIDELQRQGRAGEISREQFLAVREQLTNRAIAAMAKKAETRK